MYYLPFDRLMGLWIINEFLKLVWNNSIINGRWNLPGYIRSILPAMKHCFDLQKINGRLKKQRLIIVSLRRLVRTTFFFIVYA